MFCSEATVRTGTNELRSRLELHVQSQAQVLKDSWYKPLCQAMPPVVSPISSPSFASSWKADPKLLFLRSVERIKPAPINLNLRLNQ